MDKIEAIKGYIRRTNMPQRSANRCTFSPSEAIAICDEIEGNIDSIFLAFEYGMAKGYRAAKAEANRHD